VSTLSRRPQRAAELVRSATGSFAGLSVFSVVPIQLSPPPESDWFRSKHMEEHQAKPRAKRKWVPPKVLATYTKKELEAMMRRLGIHGSGGGGCGPSPTPTPTGGCGCG
jgi:hypothetical protein